MKKNLLICALFWGLASMLYAQTDTVPPALSCKTLVEKEISPICQCLFYPNELINSLSDNTTPAEDIIIGLRRQCTGSGFPGETEWLNLTAPATELAAEVWAMDQSGNISMCTTNLNILYNLSSCETWTTHYTLAETPQGEPVYHFKSTLRGHNCRMESFEFTDSTWSLPWATASSTPELTGYDFYVAPFKNINPKNGIDDNDIQLIYNYLTGVNTLSAWQLIAADANQDGKVTIFDVVVLRKLILGHSEQLPHDKSWRFVPKSYTFPNPANPFQPPFPERAVYSNLLYHIDGSYFIAVKIGDVNGSADPEN